MTYFVLGIFVGAVISGAALGIFLGATTHGKE